VITGVDYGEGIDVRQQGVGGTTTARILGNVVTGQGTAGEGPGAIQVYASEGAIAVSILNNTIVGNRYGIAIGGRPDLGASLSGTVANNVIANNQLRAGLTIDEFRATVETRFNLFFGNGPELESPLPLGPGSIEADPRFVGPADLHLRPTSPAVNAGDTSLVPADVTTDAGGDPRTVLTVDLGAYELQAPVPALAVAAGPGGGPQVSAFDRSGVPLPAPLGAFFPFPVGFTGGAFVAFGDVNGDEVPDLVTAAGPGGGPHVRVFDGATGSELMSFFPYAPGFTGGVRVAAGDVDGDGRADVVTAPGPGGGPDVRVFSGATGSLLTSFFAYAPAFTAGVYVAAGDVNGDGQADIVTGAGAGGGPHVQAFSGAGGGLLLSFFAYDPGFTGGVHVAAGDVTGDGRSDVVTGTGAGGGPHVRVFDGATGAEVSSLFAYDPGFIGGVFVGAHDFSGDGRADLVTGTGPGGGPHVKVFDGATGGERGSFFPFPPGFLGGVAVAGAP
jgi:hypothetical protein